MTTRVPPLTGPDTGFRDKAAVDGSTRNCKTFDDTEAPLIEMPTSNISMEDRVSMKGVVHRTVLLRNSVARTSVELKRQNTSLCLSATFSRF